MLDCRDGCLRVNLLLNRASTWVDVHSGLPHQGRVDLKIKSPCQTVLVRLPEWVPLDSDKVVCKCAVIATERTKRRGGRWIALSHEPNCW